MNPGRSNMGKRKSPTGAPRGAGRGALKRAAARCPSCQGELLWERIRGCACGWKPGSVGEQTSPPTSTGTPTGMLETVEG